MNLDNLLEDKMRESRLYGVTKPMIIKEILNIPEDIDIKNLDKNIDSFYDTFYIKKTWVQESKTKEEKIKEILNIEKTTSERYKNIPDGEEKTKYRKIVTINSEWLKTVR